MKRLAGKDALRIMIEEIGDVIGPARLGEFERKVRARVAAEGGGNAKDWIQSMAHVIVDDDDTRADQGFRKGIRRLRREAVQRGQEVV